MFVTSKSATKKIKKDTFIKASSLLDCDSNGERRNTQKERRFPLERRKTFSSLFTGDDKRKNKLEQRRSDIDRRERNQQSKNAAKRIVKRIHNLALNAASIDSLIREQMHIVKKIDKLLPFKKGLELSQIENNVREIFDDINLLMKKEEYLLCLYLETYNAKLTKVHIEKLLSIINTDISKLSDDIMQLTKKYYIGNIKQTNIGFVQLDLNAIREKIILGLYKKKKQLYPIYIIKP